MNEETEPKPPPPPLVQAAEAVPTEEEFYKELLANDTILKGINDEIESIKSGTKTNLAEHIDRLVKDRKLAEYQVYKHAELVAELTLKIEESRFLIRQTPDLIEVNYRKRKHHKFLRQKAKEMRDSAQSKCNRDAHLRRLSNKVISPPPS